MPTKEVSFVAKNYSAGLDSTSDPSNMPPEALTVCENMRYTEQGGVRNRLGIESQGNIGTGVKGDSIKGHPEFGVLFTKSDTGIYQSNDKGLTWYSIGVTRTASEYDFFHPYGKDMYVTNATDNYTLITISTANGAIADTDTEITVRTGDIGNFLSGGGTVYIRGDAISYTGVNATQLTGVTGIAAGGHPDGAIITQTTEPSGAPSGTGVTDFEGSVLVGGKTADKSVIHYSAPATEADPQFAYDFTDNGAGAQRLPSDFKAFGAVKGGVLIGMERGMQYAYTFNVDTGALLTRPLTETHGVHNARAFCQSERFTYVLTNTNRILPILDDANGVRIIDDPDRPFDLPVRRFLDEMDEDQALSHCFFDPRTKTAHFVYFKDFISRELTYQEDTGGWNIDTDKSISDRTFFEARLYGVSEDSDDVFLENEGFTDNGNSIVHRIVSPVYVIDDKRVTYDVMRFMTAGLLSGAGSFCLRLFMDGELQDELNITAEDLVNKLLMNTDDGVPIGSGLTGTITIGSSGTFDEVYPWSFPMNTFYTGERFQFEIEIDDEATSFELRESRTDARTTGILQQNFQ